MQKLAKFFTWIVNNVEKDKLIHKEVGSLVFFLACIALLVLGVNIYTSVAISTLITALFAFGKEYWFDPRYFKGNVPDIKDALWTMYGAIEMIIIILLMKIFLH